jgi:hypothetical protein
MKTINYYEVLKKRLTQWQERFPDVDLSLTEPNEMVLILIADTALGALKHLHDIDIEG